MDISSAADLTVPSHRNSVEQDELHAAYPDSMGALPSGDRSPDNLGPRCLHVSGVYATVRSTQELVLALRQSLLLAVT